METIRYTEEYKAAWNELVKNSRNGTFLIDRNYMDYHKERFVDCSLMFQDKNQIIGILPANWSEHDKTVYSHQGLTYGGLIVRKNVTALQVMEMMDEAIEFFGTQLGAVNFIYKPVPVIFHNYPSQEDLYYLFTKNATLRKRQLSCCVSQENPLPFVYSRTTGLHKAIRNGLTVQRDTNPRQFWDVLENVLSTRHNAKPVHSLGEIFQLMKAFPDEIQLYTAIHEDKVVAGALLYVTPIVAHTQYIASNEEGRNCCALDLLFDELVNKVFREKRYFDFGTSNSNDGRNLETGLLFQKESYGGRGIAYDEWNLTI